MIPATLEELKVPIGSVKPYPRNPRRGALEQIRASLERHGQYRPIVVNQATSEVLAGNHTLLAALELGWAEIAATFVDVDEETAARIVLVDNRSSDLAGYDDAELAALLSSLTDLDATGWGQRDLDKLLDEVLDTPPPDTAPALPDEPRSRPGDLYTLGEHRVLCGDSRQSGDLERVMGRDRARLVWTDPPYGVEYQGGSGLSMQNDDAGGLEELLTDVYAAVSTVLAPGAALYVAHPAGPLSLVFARCFEAAGWRLRQTLVWVKDRMVLGRSDYHYQHEPLQFGEFQPAGAEHDPIDYGYAPGSGRRGRGGDGWYGDNRQTTVLAVDRPSASREHPTMKPLELIELCMRNSSQRGDVVLDPFGGSGSTLMACEHMPRRARLVEIDPRYVDVIVERWSNHTGQTAELERAER